MRKFGFGLFFAIVCLALIGEIPLMLSFKIGFAIPVRDILLVEVSFIFYFV